MADGNGSAPRFKDVVTSLAQLREPRGEPGHYASQKVISILDETCARFIAASPFVVVATASRSGEMDVSPKGDPAGFVKVLADAETDTILGMHLVGANVSELVHEGVLAMEFKGSADDLARICHAHPSLSEAVHDAAMAVHKRAIHKAN